jgi:hypothetical protein
MPHEKAPGMGVAGVLSPRRMTVDPDQGSRSRGVGASFHHNKSTIIANDLREERLKSTSKGRPSLGVRDHYKTNWM